MSNLKINEAIVKQLNSLNLTISTCESMTGGMVANSLVQVENASKCFLGGFVSYSAFSKAKFAKVKQETIDQYGTVSKQCAYEMAYGTQQGFKSDIAISVTGNASNANPIENKPSGQAYICIMVFEKPHEFKFVSKYNTRIDIINECTAFVLFNLYEIIKTLKK